MKTNKNEVLLLFHPMTNKRHEISCLPKTMFDATNVSCQLFLITQAGPLRQSKNAD